MLQSSLPIEPSILMEEPTSLPDPTFESGEKDEQTLTDRFSYLTKDSLGNLRFIGGASSLVLVEALQSLRASQAPDASPDSLLSETVSKSTENLELPFFRPNVHFRRFDVLPAPEDIADKLVETYFNRKHYTFPILT